MQPEVDAARLRVIILAAQRPGVADPLAVMHGVSHKCLVPLLERPLIAHVLETAARHPLVAEVVVSIEADMAGAVHDIAASLAAPYAPVRSVTSAGNLADSVIAAARGFDGPIVITTADNALLQSEGLDAIATALAGNCDAAVAMARKAAVLAAHPDGQRRFYRFADDEYSNCNLYGLAGDYALAAAEVFRGGGQFAKKASRIVKAFGLVNLLLLRFHIFSLEAAIRRISERLGVKIVPVILNDGRHAIDVDNERTYGVVTALLEREPVPSPAH